MFFLTFFGVIQNNGDERFGFELSRRGNESVVFIVTNRFKSEHSSIVGKRGQAQGRQCPGAAQFPVSRQSAREPVC